MIWGNLKWKKLRSLLTLLSILSALLLSDEARTAWLKTRTGAVVGRKIADRFGWKVGDRIPLLAAIWL